MLRTDSPDCEARAALLLGADGPFARHLEGFAPRAPQQALAHAVQQAIDKNHTLVAEVGTGTGKTYAYLVPALLCRKKVIISTGTKALQDQLYFRDLPRVMAMLDCHPRHALLKGRANYLCLYRLEQTVREGDQIAPAQFTHLHAIRAWSTRTRRGDRMELTEVPDISPLWPRVTSTRDNCLGTSCPFHADCHLVKARREALEADLVIVNHHLLLADLALKQDGFADMLPDVQTVILDEAHQLPELAGGFLSQSIGSSHLIELMRDSLRECQGVSGAIGALRRPLEALEEALRCLNLAMEPLPLRGSRQLLEAGPEVVPGLRHLAGQLVQLSKALASQATRSRGLNSMHERALMLMQRLQHSMDVSDKVSIHWYERFQRGFVLHATPLELAGPLRTLRAGTAAAWIHVSATLSVAGSFAHFSSQMGLDAPQTLHLDSPFDYARQALCYLPVELPDPNTSDYTAHWLRAALPVLEASRGRAFLLFTSHRALAYAAEWLKGRVVWPLFVQGSAPRHQLLKAFRASKHGVLLGATSFWEGVDVIGQALSLVVIDRLPFAVPDDPVVKARLEALKNQGISPFMSWQIPAAAIALKQGAGRLIRDIHDRGVLMLCDPRILSKNYGRLFLDSLPPMPRTRELADVTAFFT